LVRWRRTCRGAAFVICFSALCEVRGAAQSDDPWTEIGYMNFRGAAKQFARALKGAAPGSPAGIEAKLGLALCLQHRQPDVQSDKQRAARLYDELIKETHGNPLQPVVLLLRARMADQIDFYGDKPDPTVARGLYDQLIRAWPRSPLIHRAALYRAQLAVFTMTPEGARRGIRELSDWLAKYPDNPLAYLQWTLIALTYMEPLKEPAKAVEAFRRAERVGLPAYSQRDAFYWRVANLAQMAGDRTTAVEYFRRIITEVQRSSFAYEAQERIRELGETPPPLSDPFAGKASDNGLQGEGGHER